ncbi:proton-translocating NADH-quinone oxidoreductase, chain L [Desulfofarcimen acetoxidans DSM 771]|uniref:Proton-translocating NADH-quinone oxidoreductase, chain L n=1 Tax=Desulfofarcimen acetoxidans (strain ATCC 49208 / DSM 771 / KCTC 5769 / VKM B-1644 / 5575) TaxID=485916 RepID=C8W5B5_DESAS|nr:NADH-quinone oxidoreductase subunit L [Desulfofarcimen acetoxidans]ACV62097.1 proton-translocating NADH-quinone oxidoreductase, chain L [Desulfofarcimen acetoxidans DSM 771]
MVEFAMHNAWLVPLLPAIAFLIIVFLTRPWQRLSSLVCIAGMVGAFVFAALAAYGVFTNEEFTKHSMVYATRWFSMPGLHIDFGIQLDPTSAMMMFMVSMVSTLIFIYATGYMEGDPGYSTFFAYVSLFGASMLGLVLSSNLLQMFIFWELVGLCSYLLIGFFTHKVSAREAAKKAFVTCRIADFCLLLGLLSIQIVFGTLDMVKLAEIIPNFRAYTSEGILVMIAVLVFIGPVGKSGQFPLHVWLPDAMEGPTPVSALIHAATMVVAGVYLVGRTMFLFEQVPSVMELVAFTGAFTALFAASIALTQREIKRILAYSTVSQLGYMVLALGVGSLSASMFHLWTHAFFKALMFMGAGSVLHALHHKADVWEMGGLLKKMPITGWTFVVGGVAIAGIPPFAGFWSKDEILAVTLDSGHTLLFLMAALTAFMTAFYMWRLIFLAFFGAEKPENHPHESPWNMTLPLVVLAGLATVGGLMGTPWKNYWGEWIFFSGSHIHAHHGEPNYMVMIGSVVLALCGIGLAYRLYLADSEKATAKELARRFSGLHALSYNKFYVDELYLWINHNLVDGAAKVFYLFDLFIVDGFINALGAITKLAGDGFRIFQTGRMQNYVLIFFLGVLVIAIVMAFSNPSSAGLILGGVK